MLVEKHEQLSIQDYQLPIKTDGTRMSLSEAMVNLYLEDCDNKNEPYDKLVIQEIERIYA